MSTRKPTREKGSKANVTKSR
ncbi:hypothetical protein CBM2589_A70288 [Cupriavidus taiwanensis]|uniref:Uncharacterized protein n=1 Tax=Cupriavidus taiwanensis TaxID=164546 RepID=A0A375C7R6_9BURK|nr:hypothetical protein CBM2589_A70288 [Cupriavidus taiwanensis]